MWFSGEFPGASGGFLLVGSNTRPATNHAKPRQNPDCAIGIYLLDWPLP